MFLCFRLGRRKIPIHLADFSSNMQVIGIYKTQNSLSFSLIGYAEAIGKMFLL
jgi:hypothetical protein